MVGFLPWVMLAWHRFLDRTTIARAIELGVVMCLTGLACAYYGIFAGGMIALASIWFAIDAATLEGHAVPDRRRRRRGDVRRA